MNGASLSRLLIHASILGSLFACRQARADDAHYLMVFAYESAPFRPKNAHTFATVVQVADAKSEQHTISWLPASLRVDPVKINSEPGFNLDWRQTLELARSEGKNVSVWGPYRIEKELYDRFITLKEYLDSDAVTYKTASAAHPRPYSLDCAHALEKLTSDRQRYIGPFGFGEPASARLVEILSPWIADSGNTHWEIAEQIGLKEDELIRRDFNYRPTRQTTIRRAFGRWRTMQDFTPQSSSAS